jgi:hypothetical protein
MVVMICCALAIVLALVAIWRWGTIDATAPEGPALARYLWHLNVGVSAGLMAGLLVAGPGGRLVMRLLAATAGDPAQGRLTEADEVVGRITVNGTIGFIVFVGLFGGLLSGVLYMLLRRWLPPGRLGGLVFGALLAVGLAPRIDPLRSNNPDFDLVGPGWLAIAAFCALLLLHGVAVATFVARFRSTQPLLGRSPRAVARYLPLGLALLVAPLAVAAVIGGLVFGAAERMPVLTARLRARSAMLVGRVLIAAGTLVVLPAFLDALTDIAGRGP